MAIPVSTGSPVRVDAVPGSIYRAAARTVTRVLVPAYVVMVALAVLEVVTTGSALTLQLVAVTLLVATLPGMLIAVEAVARYRVDGTLRRMDRELSVHA